MADSLLYGVADSLLYIFHYWLPAVSERVLPAVSERASTSDDRRASVENSTTMLPRGTIFLRFFFFGSMQPEPVPPVQPEPVQPDSQVGRVPPVLSMLNYDCKLQRQRLLLEPKWLRHKQ